MVSRADLSGRDSIGRFELVPRRRSWFWVEKDMVDSDGVDV